MILCNCIMGLGDETNVGKDQHDCSFEAQSTRNMSMGEQVVENFIIVSSDGKLSTFSGVPGDARASKVALFTPSRFASM